MATSEFCAAATAAANPESEVPEISVPFSYVRTAPLCCSSFRHGGAQRTHISKIVRARPSADHIAGIVSQRADERDPFGGRVQRQERVLRCGIILQQHQRLLGRPAGKGAMLGNGSCDLRAFGKRVFEEAEGELHPQDAAHGFIHYRHGHAARLDQRRQLGVVVVRHHVDVNAGHKRLLARHGGIKRDAVMRELHDSGVVGDHRAVETPLIAQDGSHQKRIGSRRHTIQRVEGGHHSGCAGLDSCVIRRQVDLAE